MLKIVRLLSYVPQLSFGEDTRFIAALFGHAKVHRPPSSTSSKSRNDWYVTIRKPSCAFRRVSLGPLSQERRHDPPEHRGAAKHFRTLRDDKKSLIIGFSLANIVDAVKDTSAFSRVGFVAGHNECEFLIVGGRWLSSTLLSYILNSSFLNV